MTGSLRRLLITRPREDAEPLAAVLRAKGYEPLVEPLLTIEPVAGPPLHLSGVQGLLFTSANGVRALAARTPRRDLAAYAVGDATARTAREAGFSRVESAAGTVEDLAVLVARRCRPEDGPLVHAAGTAVAGDLAGVLDGLGFQVERQVLYAARPSETLGQDTIRALYAGTIDAILFFSPRTAASFVRLARRAAVTDRLAGLTVLCLSEAVADAARTVPWRRVLVAERPDQPSLFALLDTA